jgi:S-DNA-T family DNA segregation ATPase FtsK/SpoIIIE
MAIDSSSRTAADIDVPDFLKPDYVPAKPAAPDVPTTRPAPRTTQSAALVAARATGRGLGHTARAAGTGGGWLGRGLHGTTRAGWRYVRATDRVESVEPRSNADWDKIREERHRRWITAAGTAGGGVVLTVAASLGLVLGVGMPAGEAFLAAPAAETAIAGAVVTGYGRRINIRRALEAAPVATAIGPGPEPEVDDGEPFPLAWCKDGEQVRTCIQRALKAEGIGARQINVLGYRGWGWEIALELKGATPGKVMAASDQIEGHLALPDGGFMPEPDSRDKSRVTVRLVASNPFADMPKPAVRPPNSLSVHDVVHMGRTMDGSTLELSLDGFCALIIGAMGAGKSLGALRTINEALTACRDAVVWDLDPIKGGLSEFGDLMARRARGPEECEEALDEALTYVSARGKLMHTLGMGDRWHATPEHPNLYINIDEFIQLSAKGKDAAIKILRTGRQYGIYLIMAGQEATADALGDAIAAIVAYRILMACRFEDVKIAFGVGAGALGWRPDRMKPAVGPVANDAGQAMIMGGALTRAIRHQFNQYTRPQITAALPERLKAGRPRMDADTLIGSGANLSTSGRGDLIADRLDALASQGGVDDARLVAILLREFELGAADFLPTSETLLPALHNSGYGEMDSERLGRILRKHAPGVTASRDTEANGRLRGWERSAVEQAAAGLMDPAGTRSQAG